MTDLERALRIAGMRVHWTERRRTTLSDLYDGDLRASQPVIQQIAQRNLIPHPLPGVAYADGVAS